MAKTKGTPLTYEDFNSEILPRIEEVVHQMEDSFSKKVLESEERVMGEIKNMREELAVTSHQYERTNKRVDKIDKHLGINTLMDDE